MYRQVYSENFQLFIFSISKSLYLIFFFLLLSFSLYVIVLNIFFNSDFLYILGFMRFLRFLYCSWLIFLVLDLKRV